MILLLSGQVFFVMLTNLLTCDGINKLIFKSNIFLECFGASLLQRFLQQIPPALTLSVSLNNNWNVVTFEHIWSMTPEEFWVYNQILKFWIKNFWCLEKNGLLMKNFTQLLIKIKQGGWSSIQRENNVTVFFERNWDNTFWSYRQLSLLEDFFKEKSRCTLSSKTARYLSPSSSYQKCRNPWIWFRDLRGQSDEAHGFLKKMFSFVVWPSFRRQISDLEEIKRYCRRRPKVMKQLFISQMGTVQERRICTSEINLQKLFQSFKVANSFFLIRNLNLKPSASEKLIL